MTFVLWRRKNERENNFFQHLDDTWAIVMSGTRVWHITLCMILEFLPFKKLSDHFEDIYKLKFLATSDVNLTLFLGVAVFKNV